MSSTSAAEARYQAVVREFQAKRAGIGDLTAALRHALRWEKEHGGQTDRRVPATPPWPSIKEWTDAGFRDVFFYNHNQLQVQASPWHPAWLDRSSNVTIEAAACKEDFRRGSSNVEADPFLPKEYVGYKSAGQREAVRAVLSAPPGSTLAVLLPTGGGKSLCAHLPALLEEGATAGLVLVVVPTVSLALDQQARLSRLIPHPTAYVAAGTPEQVEQNRAIRERIANGTQRIVFTSPESILHSLARPLYAAARRGWLSWFVVDEAHMVEQWGDEFRSAFQELTAIRTDLLRQSGAHTFRTLLLTATLTETALDTLQTLFGRPGPFGVCAANQLRPEPSFWASYCASETIKADRILEAVRHLPRPLILYTTRVEDAKSWYRLLRDRGYLRTGVMTGDTSRDKRLDLLSRWHDNALDIVVATSAFGLGVDKDDVRTVIHACVPESLDRYYQEVGRGGRDGCASISLVIFTAQDAKRAWRARKIITAELGQARWSAMVREWKPLGDGRYRVPITVAPPYNPNAFNEYNVGWNLRTITLLARAGMIELDAEPPPTANLASDAGDADIEAEFGRALQDYQDHRIVRPLVDDHESDAAWANRVVPLRERSYRATRDSMQLMRALLRGKSCASEILMRLYTIPPRPERGGIYVAPSCGGCRKCRRTSRDPFVSEANSPRSPWTRQEHLEPELAQLFGKRSVLGVFHDGLAEPEQMRSLDALVRWLAYQGVRNVVAPELLRKFLRDRLHQFALPVFLYDRYESLRLQPAATLIVGTGQDCPEGAALQEGDRRRVLLLSSATIDPLAHHRRMRDVFPHRSFELKELLTRIAL